MLLRIDIRASFVMSAGLCALLASDVCAEINCGDRCSIVERPPYVQPSSDLRRVRQWHVLHPVLLLLHHRAIGVLVNYIDVLEIVLLHRYEQPEKA